MAEVGVGLKRASREESRHRVVLERELWGTGWLAVEGSCGGG